MLSPTIFFVTLMEIIGVFQIFDFIYLMIPMNSSGMPAARSLVSYFMKKPSFEQPRIRFGHHSHSFLYHFYHHDDSIETTEKMGFYGELAMVRSQRFSFETFYRNAFCLNPGGDHSIFLSYG
jgi:hypothetical protein